MARQDTTDAQSTVAKPLPAKEAVGVVPFFGLVEVESRLPARRRFGGDAVMETIENRRRRGGSEVGEQSRHQERQIGDTSS